MHAYRSSASDASTYVLCARGLKRGVGEARGYGPPESEAPQATHFGVLRSSCDNFDTFGTERSAERLYEQANKARRTSRRYCFWARGWLSRVTTWQGFRARREGDVHGEVRFR